MIGTVTSPSLQAVNTGGCALSFVKLSTLLVKKELCFANVRVSLIGVILSFNSQICATSNTFYLQVATLFNPYLEFFDCLCSSVSDIDINALTHCDRTPRIQLDVNKILKNCLLNL